MPEANNRRKPRYRRVPRLNMILQERDARIIKLVFEHRFLTSEHIQALTQGSGQNILRRLQLLYHNGYLDRPPEQIRPYRQGSDPMVYGLGNKGADLLASEFGIPRAKVDWTSKNREAGRVFLQHALMISHFMVCLKLACQRIKGVNLLVPSDTWTRASGSAHKNKNPFSWTVNLTGKKNTYPQPHEFSMIPDKIFGLRFPKESSDQNTSFFFLECDRATMPVKTPNLNRSSYYKKMLGYWESWRQGIFTSALGIKNARVLTITTSAERIRNMIAANKEVDDRRKGSGMFLFAPLSYFNLDSPEHIFSRIWQNGRQEGFVGLVE